MSETPELLPCPFCGAQMEDYYNHSFVHPLVESREDSCILAGLSFSYLHSKWGTGEIARWNRRSPAARNSVLEEAEKDAEIARLKLALDGILSYDRNFYDSGRPRYEAIARAALKESPDA